MKITRRQLLYLLGFSGILYIINKMVYPLQYIFTRSEGTFPTKEGQNAFKSRGSSVVAIVKGKNVEEMVRKSVDMIGGIEKLGVKGKEVLVKPNVNSDDPYPATTNPEVVKSVVKLLYEAGASKVKVGDMSGIYWLPTIKCMEKVGIKKAAEETGAEVITFDDGSWVTIEPPQAKYFKSFMVAKAAYEAEKIISLPVIKTHRIATYSMSLKNFVGVIHPNNRQILHFSDMLEEMVAEINLAVHPSLIIMDGTKSMIAGGPASGTVRETNLIVASGDRIAIDIVGLSIVKNFGEWEKVSKIGVWDQRQIKRAIELDLGAKSPRDIELLAQSLDSNDTKFLQFIESINKNIGLI